MTEDNGKSEHNWRYLALWVGLVIFSFVVSDAVWALSVGLLLGFISGVWGGINVVTWITIRAELDDPESAPFNWRVFAGPNAYYGWLEKRDDT